MEFLSFPYFWFIRVSPIRRLWIKFEYFLQPSEISHIFKLSRVDSTLYIQNLKSEFTLSIVPTVNFGILPHCLDEFLVQLLTTNAKKLILKIPLEFI